ncbi:hypothetical protein JCM11251_001085 [Rhodosporidiobolus azoricus]
MLSSSPRMFTFFALFGLLAVANAAPLSPRAWYKSTGTPHGSVLPYTTSLGDRYTVPYAKAPTGSLRFKDPVPIDSFAGSRHFARCRKPRKPRRYDASKLPPACPQGYDASAGSEDCLYMTIYAPPAANDFRDLPVFVWLHGGSFFDGSSSALDGAALARSQEMIVVTVQYRLGALGWLKSDALGLDGNYGLKDVIQALKVIQTDISSFGGNPKSVTLAGQSSGAEIIKSLLVTPSATPLFARAILQSAPLDTVDQSPAVANDVSSVFLSGDYGMVNCDTISCLQEKNLQDILLAQGSIRFWASTRDLVDGAALAEPLRTVIDGSLVTRDFRQVVSSGGQLEGANKEIIFTTVTDEGCSTISGLSVSADGTTPPLLNDHTDPAVFPLAVGLAYPDQASSILASGLYDPDTAANADSVRESLLRLNTDFSWTCPNQQTAVRLTASSGFSKKVYLGEFDLGVSHDGGSIDFCKNRVDHEDDIAVVFSSPSTHSGAQKTLASEVQARWGAFAATGNPTPKPNFGGYSSWPTVSAFTGDLNVLQLGNTSNGKSAIAKSQRDEQCKVGSGLYVFA